MVIGNYEVETYYVPFDFCGGLWHIKCTPITYLDFIKPEYIKVWGPNKPKKKDLEAFVEECCLKED